MRLILIFFVLITISACQHKAVKPEVHAEPKPLETKVLLAGIKQCQNNPDCLEALNHYFTDLAHQAKIEAELADDVPPEANESKTTTSNATDSPIETEQPALITAPPAIDLNEPLLSNIRVQAALNEWLTWKRPKLIETWQNYQYLRNKIWPPVVSYYHPRKWWSCAFDVISWCQRFVSIYACHRKTLRCAGHHW